MVSPTRAVSSATHCSRRPRASTMTRRFGLLRALKTSAAARKSAGRGERVGEEEDCFIGLTLSKVSKCGKRCFGWLGSRLVNRGGAVRRPIICPDRLGGHGSIEARARGVQQSSVQFLCSCLFRQPDCPDGTDRMAGKPVFLPGMTVSGPKRPTQPTSLSAPANAKRPGPSIQGAPEDGLTRGYRGLTADKAFAHP